jgi:diamine N-acetyltransferase
MDLKIRIARHGDESVLCELHGTAHALHVAAVPDYFRRPAKTEVANWFAGLLDAENWRIWLAVSGDSVAGYLAASFERRPANPFCQERAWLEIDQIAVHPDFRRSGVARALLATAELEAAAKSVDLVELNVWAFNNVARAAFQSAGFAARAMRLERRVRRNGETAAE